MAALNRIPAWVRIIILTLLAGQAAALSFPPSPNPIGLMLGLAAVAFYLDGRSPRRVFWIGWLFGLSWHFGALYWIANAFLVPMPQMGALALLPVLALAAAFALFIALAFYLWRRFWPGADQASAASYLGLAIALSLSEYAYGHLFTGFAWDLTALAFVDTRFIHTGAWFGAYGVGLLALAAVMVLAGAARRWISERRTHKYDVALTSGLSAALLAGFLLPSAPLPMAPAPDAITIRMVQGNTPQHLKWRPEHQSAIFNRHTALSAKDAAPKPQLIIWPETATPFYAAESEPVLKQLGGLAADDGFVIIGSPVRKSKAGGGYDYTNSMLAIDNAGAIVGRYDKAHLVPFGEYIPLSRYLPFEKLVPGRGSFIPGPGVKTMRLNGLPSFSPLICYEVIFPGAVTGAERPDFLLNITNDAWYGQSAGPHQHLAISRMRAIEEGLPLIRVANTGISAAYDGHGNELTRIPLEQAGAADIQLPSALPPTLYAQFGDRIYGLMLILFIIAAVLARRMERKL